MGNGNINVIISVTDGEYIDDAELLVEVLPVNDPPEISEINIF